MVAIRQIEAADLVAIASEPYSVTIDEPGAELERLTTLFRASGFWREHAGAVAIDSGGLKGTVQFFRSGPTIHGYELGYVIHDRCEWSKGYASEGLKLLSNRLFAERPGVVRHQLTVSCENTASWRVAERCGFMREGILRASGSGDQPEDSFIYSRVRGRFDRDQAGASSGKVS